ncbi:MAG: hypothetical protein ABH849_02485 [Nanoarchaeota archaeon]
MKPKILGGIIFFVIVIFFIVEFNFPNHPIGDEWFYFSAVYHNDNCLNIDPGSVSINLDKDYLKYYTYIEKECVPKEDFMVDISATNINFKVEPSLKLGDTIVQNFKKSKKGSYNIYLDMSGINERTMLEIKLPIISKFYKEYSLIDHKGIDYIFFVFKEGFFGYNCDGCFYVRDGIVEENPPINYEGNIASKKYFINSSTTNFGFSFNPERPITEWVKGAILALVLGLLILFFRLEYVEKHPTLDTIKKKIMNSDADDWTFDDNEGIYTYKKDTNLTMRRSPADEDREYHESWMDVFPDATGRGLHHVIYYGGSFIEKVYMVAVDGFRSYIPFPKRDFNRDTGEFMNLKITKYQYKIGRIINDSFGSRIGSFDSYLEQAKIRVSDN